MYHNNENSQLSQISNNVLGLDDGDSLLSNDNKYDEDSDVGYGDDPHPYLDSDDEDLPNLLHEEMNMSNQAEQDGSLSVSSGEEYGYEDEWAEEDEDANRDTFTDQQYSEGLVEGMIFCSVKFVFAFCKEHSRLTGFGVIKTGSNQKGGENGENHHKQSILLGCTLITSKDIETYKYAFSTWFMVMGNAPPTAIPTDQCESINGSIREVLPDIYP
ncbi:hypothetical protein RDI58_022431 [Solanum bulbocastanum]|uniref:Protein FAR1-RELATED SEQUENCE n=1 Tax=Solanum bulbocastanum TaxID=147425 RepID=A0AAN8T7K9_SOLBU